jgi:cytochrome oxidase Cu insertion factor (SCO1/SenC/PrrC family)
MEQPRQIHCDSPRSEPGALAKVVRVAALSGSLAAAGALPLDAAFPVHGTVLRQEELRHALVRLEAVPSTQPALVERLTLSPARRLRPGTPIDAIQRGRVLLDVTPSGGYAAGMPDDRVLTTLNLGDPVPRIPVIDQTGRLLDLSRAWPGMTVVLSFVFTRCPDARVCPAITGKFAYLQAHLDGARTHLVEVTLDPRYDSPRVLAAYAARFGAVPEQWSIVTGEQNQIGYLINRFGLSNLENAPGNFVHDDVLAIISPDGIIRQRISTVGWSPDDVIAGVLHEQGDESNPLRRLELASIASIASLCGGDATTGQVVLDSIVFVAGVLFFGGLLWLFGRRIWRREPR